MKSTSGAHVEILFSKIKVSQNSFCFFAKYGGVALFSALLLVVLFRSIFKEDAPQVNLNASPGSSMQAEESLPEKFVKQDKKKIIPVAKKQFQSTNEQTTEKNDAVIRRLPWNVLDQEETEAAALQISYQEPTAAPEKKYFEQPDETIDAKNNVSRIPVFESRNPQDTTQKYVTTSRLWRLPPTERAIQSVYFSREPRPGEAGPIRSWQQDYSFSEYSSQRSYPPIEPAVVFQPDLNQPSEVFTSDEQPAFDSAVNPPVLRDPEGQSLFPSDAFVAEGMELIQTETFAPLGFSGRSSVLPTVTQTDSHFVPVEDRWRIGFPDWDRYNKQFPKGVDYQYKKGVWWDPYNQNVLKGDYPIIGQHTFLNLEILSLSLFEGRQVPTATTPFESTVNPRQSEFFGDPNQFFYFQPIFMTVDLFHGQAGFKQFNWQVRLTGAFNGNHLDVGELAVVNPDVRRGTVRSRHDWSLEEWFVEAKLADTSPHYDFVSVRAGSQFFVSDFRGFIFNDTNRGVRLFGTRLSNREQFNIVWFDQQEKETNSGLNTFDDRHQNTVIANYFRQDFIFPGYTTQLSFHYNRDQGSTKFDENDFLVRPDPVGVFRPHEVNAYYIGWASDGHINRFNINHAFYVVLGRDELNPIGGKKQDIFSQMAALEVSYDRDWARFRSSFLWFSGDNDPNDGDAEGFDAIFGDPNFAGGEFSYWQRQAIQLFGVRLVNDRSLTPNLRSSRIKGQSNFVNPGLFLFNLGMDADLTPKLKLISNLNFLWFDDTEALELFTFQGNLHNHIGADLSLGAEYRPKLHDNLMIVGGIAGLIPGDGFKDIYNPLRGEAPGLFAGFVELIATY